MPDRLPLETAFAYVELGLSIHPCCPPHHTCGPKSHGKRPWDPGSGAHPKAWQEHRLPTCDEIDRWLVAESTRVHGGSTPANLGALCGPRALGEDGLIGADADGEQGIVELARHHGLAPGALEAALADHVATGLFALDLGTVAYVTPSSGIRLLWRAPSDAMLRTVGNDRGHNGLRLMWAGGQVVLPPSVGANGHEYRYLPAHSPWQCGFAHAPASVLTAMRADSRREPSAASAVTVRPVPAYPAATDLLGPFRDGRLMPSAWLPYDHRLLHEGSLEGDRSESVWRLEFDMLRAEWRDVEIVAVLAAQPWVRGMEDRHGPIIAYLFADLRRAREELARRDEADERLAIQVEGCELHPTANETDAVECGSVGPAARATPDPTPEPVAQPVVASAPAWTFNRHHWGTRLRAFEPERDSAVRRGADRLLGFLRGLAHPTRSHVRLLEHVQRLLGSFDRCRHTAWGHPQDLRDERERDRGTAWTWGDQPCDGRGHEECAPYHALRELQPQWGAALSEVYGAGVPVAVLTLSAPGWGLPATRKAATGLLNGAKVKRAIGLCAGFIGFEPGEAPGYALNLVVPGNRVDDLRLLLVKEWRQRVPAGWGRVLDDVPPRPTALEALVELRVRSEQAILLALGRGEIELDRAIRLYAAETGAYSDSKLGGQRHRLVVAPGMRKLAQDIREGVPRLAAAVGGETEDRAAEGASGRAGQGDASTAPTNTGMGPDGADPIPVITCDDPGGPCAAGDAEVPAASGGGVGSGDGWVPCPWDPSLKMRPSTRKGLPRALPWWKLQRMAERGLVEPIIHNGRVIGYLEPLRGPGRGRGA